MNRLKRSNSILSYITITLLLVAVAIRGGATFDWLLNSDEPVYSISDIKEAFPDAVEFMAQADKSNSIINDKGESIGYVIISDELEARYQGYGGDVPLLIATGTDSKIISTQLLANKETGEFLDHIEDTKLLHTWDGMPLDTTLLQLKVDAITGATKTSTAIIRTFEESIANYLHTEQQSRFISVLRIAQLVSMALLLFLSLSMVLGQRFKKLYWFHLILVFLVMGLWLKKMLSLELIDNWLTNGFPWQSNWELIGILLLSIGMSALGHKKYYCNYLCPMGAVQILTSRISPFKKRNIKLKVSVLTLRNMYLTFIWASLILGFALPLSNMEPFMAFSFKVASSIMLLAGLLIIITSLFFNRPWCQLCPTGCLLDSVSTLKNNHK